MQRGKSKSKSKQPSVQAQMSVQGQGQMSIQVQQQLWFDCFERLYRATGTMIRNTLAAVGGVTVDQAQLSVDAAAVEATCLEMKVQLTGTEKRGVSTERDRATMIERVLVLLGTTVDEQFLPLLAENTSWCYMCQWLAFVLRFLLNPKLWPASPVVPQSLQLPETTEAGLARMLLVMSQAVGEHIAKLEIYDAEGFEPQLLEPVEGSPPADQGWKILSAAIPADQLDKLRRDYAVLRKIVGNVQYVPAAVFEEQVASKQRKAVTTTAKGFSTQQPVDQPPDYTFGTAPTSGAAYNGGPAQYPQRQRFDGNGAANLAHQYDHVGQQQQPYQQQPRLHQTPQMQTQQQTQHQVQQQPHQQPRQLHQQPHQLHQQPQQLHQQPQRQLHQQPQHQQQQQFQQSYPGNYSFFYM